MIYMYLYRLQFMVSMSDLDQACIDLYLSIYIVRETDYHTFLAELMGLPLITGTHTADIHFIIL